MNKEKMGLFLKAYILELLKDNDIEELTSLELNTLNEVIMQSHIWDSLNKKIIRKASRLIKTRGE